MKTLRLAYATMESLRSDLQDQSVFSYPVKGFGKYDPVSRMTCCVAALALYDAEMSYGGERKHDMGIAGTNTDGCLQSNVDFFTDFVEHGRTAGRANLFVHTLPSIPVAQAAIYFKCGGPLLYVTCQRHQMSSLLIQCDRMIRRGESRAMLAVKASEGDAVCFLVNRETAPSRQAALGVAEAIDIAEKAAALDEMIDALQCYNDRSIDNA